MAPPAQPPRSVAQKPLVIDWLVQRLGNADNESPSRGATAGPPTAVNSQSATELDLPASATELSNKQVSAGVSAARRAD